MTPAPSAETATTMNDASKPALDYLHRLLSRPASDQPALAGLLAELAGAFRAAACGVAALPDGRALLRHPSTPDEIDAVWPWQTDPSLVDRARRDAVAF